LYFCHENERVSVEVKIGDKTVEGGMKKLISTGERIQVYQMEFKGGTNIPEHAHPEEQAGYIVKGKFEVNIGGEKGILGPGSYYWIPGNTPHSGFIHEDTIFMDIYSPAR
jgi:quercetin dioxygenase-like cupin family protein